MEIDHTVGVDVDVDLLLNENAFSGNGGVEEDEMMDMSSMDDDEDDMADDEDDEFSYTDGTTSGNGRSTRNKASAHRSTTTSSTSSSSSSTPTKPSNLPDFTSFDRDEDSVSTPAARQRLLLSNALERDPPLDFSAGATTTTMTGAGVSSDVNNSMGPLGATHTISTHPCPFHPLL